MAESNEVLIRFRNSRFADAFQKWMLDGAKRDHIRKFFSKSGENEWTYEEDETATPGDFWLPGKND